ncbi:hypothetical protein BKA66DRAFT_264085 [Pyrenochaeta sp. MPI-SDFR-AT-0127]|nr:hypothetical protein BKA66DRAFT_264085 [Pyrenochaeta sp. MPI-SDFR-AT-0127]
MYYSATSFALAAFITTVHSHAAILAAVGDSGESRGFLVNPDVARNCTTISPCQQDATIIRDNEIAQNIVNKCGRTQLNGNIDVGAETENELAAGRMTTVSAGSMLAVTIHQVNADGAGPFECELDETSNAGSTLTPLVVSNNIPGANGFSQTKEQAFTINVQMPQNFNCIGSSTGNICAVRCRNNALAGPFGGCFAVQQTDGTGRVDSSPSAIETAGTLEGVAAQTLQNQKDFPAAVAANQAAGAAGGNAGASAISALITATVDPALAATAAAAAAAAGNGNGNGNGKQNANGNQRGNGNGGNGNQNGNQGANGDANANGQANAGKANAGQANAGQANAGQVNAGNANAGQANANGKTNGNGRGNTNGNANGNGRGKQNNRMKRERRSRFL